MTIYEIKLPQTDGEPFRFNADLFGNRYQFYFRPNVRANRWSFEVTSPSDTVIWVSRAVSNYSMLSRCPSPEKPPGQLMLVDTSGSGEEPGLSDLGARVKLVYDDGL